MKKFYIVMEKSIILPVEADDMDHAIFEVESDDNCGDYEKLWRIVAPSVTEVLTDRSITEEGRIEAESNASILLAAEEKGYPRKGLLEALRQLGVDFISDEDRIAIVNKAIASAQ